MRAPWLPPKTSDDGRVFGQPERSTCFLLRQCVPHRDRPADHARLPVHVTGVGEEEPLHERRRKPVREPDMRVRFGERGRDAAEPRREHHRPGDVAAASEHDVGPPAREDAQARDGRGRREAERPQELRPGAARETRDAEGVERVAALRNEPRLDAIRRPGERHCHPARAERFRDCERRRDVTHRAPGRDQTPELLLLCHGHERC